MGLTTRLGTFLKPGLGYGGFCFPKDVQPFVYLSPKSEWTLKPESHERVNKQAH